MKKKLTINKQTIRTLGSGDLRLTAGGLAPTSFAFVCGNSVNPMQCSGEEVTSVLPTCNDLSCVSVLSCSTG